jgi:hypothetical protein
MVRAGVDGGSVAFPEFVGEAEFNNELEVVDVEAGLFGRSALLVVDLTEDIADVSDAILEEVVEGDGCDEPEDFYRD